MKTAVLAAGGKATITLLSPALIRLTWLPDTAVFEADARDVLEQSLRLVDHVPYAILVDMRQIASLSAGARDAFSSETFVLAAAMLGHTPVDRVIAASVQQSVHEIRFFTVEHDALTWLAGISPCSLMHVLCGVECGESFASVPAPQLYEGGAHPRSPGTTAASGQAEGHACFIGDAVEHASRDNEG